MANDDYSREASAVAFQGRVRYLQDANPDAARLNKTANLSAPGLSCALLGPSGRAFARSGPVEFEVDGVGVGGFAEADSEVYDRDVEPQTVIYSRTRITGLRLGVDTRFRMERAEVDCSSTFHEEGINEAKRYVRTFNLGTIVAAGVEFNGKPIKVGFWKELPSSWAELQAKLEDPKHRSRVIERYPDYVKFHIVDFLEVAGQPLAGCNNRLALENLGKVEFGVVRAGEYFRDFTVAQFTLGSPVGGVALAAGVSNGGKTG